MVRIARLSDGGRETFGIVRDGQVATREEIIYGTGVPLPAGTRDFMFDGWLDEVRDGLGGLPYAEKLAGFGMLSPIESPPKILCLAFNYPDHAKENDISPPDDPVVVIKPRTALCGHGQDILLPGFVKKLDYEIELAIIIGRDCKDVTEEGAREAVFGYVILNDVSARDIQFRDGQFTRAKGLDTFAPCGPYVTTADEIPDPGNLRMTTRVNGELRQDSSTKKMHIKPFEIVSRLSRSMTLERGDIISTGTPAGTVMNNPSMGYLADGDRIEMEIEGLGVLANTVRTADGP